MRILIYSYNYYPEPIGIAPLMTELAEGMVKRGHEVRVVTAMPWYPEGEICPEYRGKLFKTEEINGVQVQRSYIWTRRKRSVLNRAGFELSFMLLSLFQAFKGWRPDIIFLTVPGLPVAISAAIVGAIYRTPIILNLQDILPDAAVHVGLIKNLKVIKILEKLEKFAYGIATKISVIADGFTKNIVSKGVSLDKITEIPNWVDINFIRPLSKKSSSFRERNNLQNKFVVLYSGNIALTQGLETVIDASSHLKHLPDVEIVIVGESKALKRLRGYCDKKGVKNVTLLPFEPRENLPDMLAAADVGLVVQKKNVLNFNMPSKIQVLLASGRAIIGSVPKVGTAARALSKSGAGLVVPPEDPQALAEAIEKLYRNNSLAVNLGLRGRDYAERNYSFDLAMDRYEMLFKSVIKEPVTTVEASSVKRTSTIVGKT